MECAVIDVKKEEVLAKPVEGIFYANLISRFCSNKLENQGEDAHLARGELYLLAEERKLDRH